MKGIILAAGRGSRMGSITNDIPKCMIELNGITLLDHQISALKDVGINEIGVVKGYRSEKILVSGIESFMNVNWHFSNMLVSLSCAEQWLSSNTCIISYSDIFYESKALELLMNCDEDIVITYYTKWHELWTARFDDPLTDAENFKLDQNGYVSEIGNTAKKMNEIEGQYMGLMKIAPNGWRSIREYIGTLTDSEFNQMDMTRLFSNLIHKGYKIYAIPYDGLWLEVDSADDLHLYQTMIT